MNPLDRTLIRGYVDHNFDVLRRFVGDPKANAMFMVERMDVEKGKPGKIHNCAAAIAARSYFGNRCSPSVKQIDEYTYLDVSDPKTRKRFRMKLHTVLFEEENVSFDPEQFDRNNGISVQGGSMILKDVSVDSMPIDKHPPKRAERRNERPRGKRKSHEARTWGPTPVKKATAKINSIDAPSQQGVLDSLLKTNDPFV